MAAAAIVEFADEIGASMIVMASHGRSGVSRWLLGSVTDKTVQSSSVPVLVVPVRDRTLIGPTPPGSVTVVLGRTGG